MRDTCEASYTIEVGTASFEIRYIAYKIKSPMCFITYCESALFRTSKI